MTMNHDPRLSGGLRIMDSFGHALALSLCTVRALCTVYPALSQLSAVIVLLYIYADISMLLYYSPCLSTHTLYRICISHQISDLTATASKTE